ncbi:MAG: hypothetical protein IT291_05410 [Deltaproteobacteria bacterium]|nr:hypothetical protein [Deltaproteobacteria bacterium]
MAKYHANKVNFKVLIQSTNRHRSEQLRQSLKSLGFKEISCCNSHVEAMDRFKFRKFTHVLFDANSHECSVKEFVVTLRDLDAASTLIAVSSEPRIDDVFGLLVAGARHFLGIPFTVEVLDEVLQEASEGPPLNEAVLTAPDRNSALVTVILNNLCKLTVIMRQSREFQSAARDLVAQQKKYYQSVDLAKTFCQGSDDDLLQEIMAQCIKRAQTAASRLGRMRKRLGKQRLGGSDVEEENVSEEDCS